MHRLQGNVPFILCSIEDGITIPSITNTCVTLTSNQTAPKSFLFFTGIISKKQKKLSHLYTYRGSTIAIKDSIMHHLKYPFYRKSGKQVCN